MTLNTEQQSALNRIISFVESSANVFILTGYAGTGKTTLLKILLERIRESHKTRPVMLFAPTGRAAKILLEKTGAGSTIHKGIYVKASETIKYKEDENFELSVNTEDPTEKLIFNLNLQFKNLRPIVIVDEASMISSKTTHDDRLQFGTGNLLDDLISFAGIENGGQLIFIGDDAQLPPVTDSYSAALSIDFFSERGLSVRTATLKQVMRQGRESIILENAMIVRDNIFKDRKNRIGFDFTHKEGVFSDIATSVAVIEYARNPDSTIIITHSNTVAAKYNASIRSRLFPDHPEPVAGDRVLVVKNTYNAATTDNTDGMCLFNGEFCHLTEVNNEEIKTVFVGKEKVTLRFRDVKLRHESGTILSLKIVSNLLDSPTPNLTELESKALFSEFTSRHPELLRKEKKDELLMMLCHDPYFNALQVKYGYAITCHKAQGGEWENVIVDFTGRCGLNTDALRWTYTAITRATNHLMLVSYTSTTPLSKLDIKPIQYDYIAESECHADEKEMASIKSPYHSAEASPCKQKKYASVLKVLKPDETIVDVTTRDWQESYKIRIGESVFRYDTTHDKRGVFRPFTLVTKPTTAEASDLLMRLNAPLKPDSRFNYIPSTTALEYLESAVRECANFCNILITNIVEHKPQYYVTYYFFTTTYHKIQFYFNEKGDITTAFPFTCETSESATFSKLIQMISDARN